MDRIPVGAVVVRAVLMVNVVGVAACVGVVAMSRRLS